MPKLPIRVDHGWQITWQNSSHQAISTTRLNEQECYDALWSYITWQYEIDFVCNPEKRDQIITDVEKRKAKLLEDAGLCCIED